MGKKDKGDFGMRTHIEYDDFGEYVEAMDDLMEYDGRAAAGQMTDRKDAGNIVYFFQKILWIVAAVTIMFCTSSYASGCIFS